MIVEKEKTMPLTLKRQELRFVVPMENHQRVVDILSADFTPVRFDVGTNRTVYYNNGLHEVPWDCTLRSRKYIGTDGSNGHRQLDAGEDYFAEMKFTNGLRQRKERGEMRLGDTASYLAQATNLRLNEPLRPFFMVEYDRTHFEPKESGTGLRLTLDKHPAYYSIDESLRAEKVGVENTARLEIKQEEGGDPERTDRLIQEFAGLDIFPVISKKMAACNSEKITLHSNGEKPLVKDIPNVEIESKLTVVDSDPFVFFNGLVWHYKNATSGFVVDPTFPYVYETDTVNFYYRSPKDTRTEGVKLLALPTTAKVIAKANSEIIKDAYGLGCILKRDEIKGDMIPLMQASIDEVLQRRGNDLRQIGSLDRTRKVVYLMSNTGRVYHVSLDRCIDRNDRTRWFSQLEIEYSGILGGDATKRGNEDIVIKELSELTNEISTKFSNSVTPSPLRKIDWILGKI